MKRYLPFLLFGLFALCMAQVPGIPDSTFPVFRANLNASLAYISSALAGKEPALGNPTVDDYVLSSKASGKRSWVPQTGGGGGGGTGPSSWASWGRKVKGTPKIFTYSGSNNFLPFSIS